MEISLQPWNSFKPDGVILFSDILTPLPGLGVAFDIDDNKARRACAFACLCVCIYACRVCVCVRVCNLVLGWREGEEGFPVVWEFVYGCACV